MDFWWDGFEEKVDFYWWFLGTWVKRGVKEGLKCDFGLVVRERLVG